MEPFTLRFCRSAARGFDRLSPNGYLCHEAQRFKGRSAGLVRAYWSGENLLEPFTLSLSKRCARLRQAQPERVFVPRGPTV